MGIEKTEELEIQLSASVESQKKQGNSRKNNNNYYYFCFIDYPKVFDCVDHNKLWTIFKEMVVTDHLTCLLRNLYAGQEATVGTGLGTMYWLYFEKGV